MQRTYTTPNIAHTKGEHTQPKIDYHVIHTAMLMDLPSMATNGS